MNRLQDSAPIETDGRDPAAGGGATWAGTLLKVSLTVSLIILLNFAASWASARLEMQFWPRHLEVVDKAVLIGVILYIFLMAMPFVPGIEVGLVLMMVLGPRGVLLIYLCTLIALAVSFVLGRLFPAHLLASFLGWLQLTRAEAMLRSFDAVPTERRLEFLAARASKRILPTVLKRRYLLLALLLNLPGNALIGGAGGIAMMAGMCRLYSFPKYLLLVAVAILPGPVLVMLSNYY
jgi:hypothetical protein